MYVNKYIIIHHEVDSSEVAFKIASSMAFKEACQKAQATIAFKKRHLSYKGRLEPKLIS